MNDDAIAAPLAQALAAKGYETLTAVQEAVLVPEVAGRDLLVRRRPGRARRWPSAWPLRPRS